jgi:acyl carrier protein
MPDTAVLTKDEILEKTREVLVEALVLDPEEITPTSSLTADLQAESIDFLDIVFRL